MQLKKTSKIMELFDMLKSEKKDYSTLKNPYALQKLKSEQVLVSFVLVKTVSL